MESSFAFTTSRIRPRQHISASNRTTTTKRCTCSTTTRILLSAIVVLKVLTACDAFSTTRTSPAAAVSHGTTLLEYAAEPCLAPRFDSLVPNDATDTTMNTNLPTWLRTDQSHLAESNLQSLCTTLRNHSFFTETETLKLRKAILDASGTEQDAKQLQAGAAVFCLLLSETMEMGFNALVAAAFHYCHCVRHVRQQQSSSPYHDATSTTMEDDTTTTTNNASYLSSSLYGSHVQSLVQDLDRLKQLERVMANNNNNRRHNSENVRYLLLTETRDWRALAIRCGACLYRLRGILEAASTASLDGSSVPHSHNRQPVLTPEVVRTCREALHIYAPLASRMGMHRLKNELEGAAFRILYRRQYNAVQNWHVKKGGDPMSSCDRHLSDNMCRILETVRSDILRLLQNDDEFSSSVEEFQVSARVKEPYSMWKKMLRNRYTHVLQVPDALALRIVLKAKVLDDDEDASVTRARERALCYYAQTLCRQHYPPVWSNPRFKDYIQFPKPNGYQSLHYTATTLSDGQSWTMEIQVRSAEMHQTAEFGLASHWDYKESVSSQQQQTVQVQMADSNDAYLQNVAQFQNLGDTVDASPASSEPVVLSDIWQSKERADRIRARTERLQPYLEALTTTKSDLRHKVFVFLTHNDNTNSQSGVLALPAGACVLDAMRLGEQSLGVPLSAALVNGEQTHITQRLQNGDVLELSSP